MRILFLITLIACTRKPVAENITRDIPAASYYIMADKVNLRATPSLSGDVLAVLKYGTTLEVLPSDTFYSNVYALINGNPMSGSWIYVAIADGTKGYIFSRLMGIRFPNDTSFIAFYAVGVHNSRLYGEEIAFLSQGYLLNSRVHNAAPLLSQTAATLKLLNHFGLQLGALALPKHTRPFDDGAHSFYENARVFDVATPLSSRLKSQRSYLAIASSPDDQRSWASRPVELPAANVVELMNNLNNVFNSRNRNTALKSPFVFQCNDLCQKTAIEITESRRLSFVTVESPFESTSVSAFGAALISATEIRMLVINTYEFSGDATRAEHLLGVTDFDQDGRLEIWTEVRGWESHCFNMYSFDNIALFPVFSNCD